MERVGELRGGIKSEKSKRQKNTQGRREIRIPIRMIENREYTIKWIYGRR